MHLEVGVPAHLVQMAELYGQHGLFFDAVTIAVYLLEKERFLLTVD